MLLTSSILEKYHTTKEGFSINCDSFFMVNHMLINKFSFRKYMVLDPPKRKVNVTRMIIYSFIPILAMYAGWRIQKFWVIGAIQLVVGFVVGYHVEGYLGYYSYLATIPHSIVLSIFVVRHYAKKYNKKISYNE